MSLGFISLCSSCQALNAAWPCPLACPSAPDSCAIARPSCQGLSSRARVFLPTGFCLKASVCATCTVDARDALARVLGPLRAGELLVSTPDCLGFPAAPSLRPWSGSAADGVPMGGAGGTELENGTRIWSSTEVSLEFPVSRVTD